MKERVQKLMALANVGSRRACEALIEQGRVRINNQIATLGDKADPETDIVEVDGTRLSFDQRRVYFAVHKPKQVLVTGKPHRTDNRPTVRDLLPYSGHLFSIGRLDADSEGLVIMTNDGALAQKLTHPRFRHTKTYRVTVQGLPTAATIEKWRDGVYLDEIDGRTAPCLVEIIKGGSKESILRIVMTEGKKRQIRRVGNALGHRVTRLVRTQIGMLELGNLPEGAYRELSERDVELLSTPAPEFRQFLVERARARRYGGTARTSEEPHARSPRRFDESERPRSRRDDDTRSPRRFDESERPRSRRDDDTRP
ncbi:MAG: pseudouridine synthase, partial [Anaerolinea sp.]|nr:pseudouridine synthase [Anaerolinea sp.]